MSAETYLDRVAFELRDLPWGMRRELLAELHAHLAELPDDTNLDMRLGPPATYAAELRAAAGLERRRGPIAFLRARRPRNLVLTALALTVLGLVIGVVVWIDSYQPLAFASATEDPVGAKQAPAGGSESVVFHKGRPFRYGIDVANTGSFTIRILGVPHLYGLPVSTRLYMSGPMRVNYAGLPEPVTPFRPFDLHPGEARTLLLKGVYSRCANWSPGLADVLWSFPVRYSFLWRTRTADIRLPETLAIVFRKGSCPKR